MKRLIKRFVFYLIIIVLCYSNANSVYAAKAKRYGDFEYKYNENYKGIEITAYKGNDSKVVIPTVIDGVSVNSIGAYAFYNEEHIQQISIPEGIDYLGVNCFSGCGFYKVEMPKNIEYMDESVFSSCSFLEEVSLPLNISSIPMGTFANCSSLKSVNNMKNVSEIGEAAFEMSGIKNIDLSKCKKLRIIRESAFRACQFKEIKLPASLKVIGEDAFLECSFLEKVSFQKGSQLNTIGYGAFQSCTDLKSITLPKKLKEIDSRAFYYCRKLNTIKFQGNVPKMAGGVFSKINSKATFYVPNKYKSQYTLVLKKNKWLKSKMKIKKL